MTVTAIQVGESASPGPAANAVRAAQSEVRTGVQSGAESFSSGWQSLLASMGAGEHEPEAAEATGVSGRAALPGQALGNSSKATNDSQGAAPVATKRAEDSTGQTKDARVDEHHGVKHTKQQTAQIKADTSTAVPAGSSSEMIATALPAAVQNPALDSVQSLLVRPESVPQGPKTGENLAIGSDVNPGMNRLGQISNSEHVAPGDASAGLGILGGGAPSAGKSSSAADSMGNRSEPLKIEGGAAANRPVYAPAEEEENSPPVGGPEAISHARESLAPGPALSSGAVSPGADIPAADTTQGTLLSGNLQTGLSSLPNPEVRPGFAATASDGGFTGPAAVAATAETRGVGSVRGVGTKGQPATKTVQSIRAGAEGSSPAAGPQGNLEWDSAAATRGVGGSLAAVIQASGDSGSSTAATPGAGLRETFAALDGANPSSTTSLSPTWVHAGSQRAEAGFQDPALGWVGVRADGTGARVHAAILPGSAEAATALGGNLAGLNSYLDEQHLHVSSVTVTPPDSHSTESSAGPGGDQGMQQGEGQSSNQGSNQASQNGSTGSGPLTTQRGELGGPAIAKPGIATPERNTLASEARLGSGSHISVMA